MGGAVSRDGLVYPDILCRIAGVIAGGYGNARAHNY